MSKLNMQAHLCRLPVNIEEIFFGEQQIKVHPSNPEQFSTTSPKEIIFSSSISILDELNKRIQVSVQFETSKEHTPLIEFKISCIGIYTWEGDNLDDNALKNIYNWGISVQTGVVRQKLSEVLQTSPYHEVWYLPVSFVKIEHVTPTTKNVYNN